jgi:hypothetical protein
VSPAAGAAAPGPDAAILFQDIGIVHDPTTEVSVNSMCNRLAAPAFIAALALASAASADDWNDRSDWEEEHAAERMIADTLIVRPVGIAATVFGSVTYVISLPFSYFGGNQQEAQEALVEEPARHSFQRPLGRDF